MALVEQPKVVTDADPLSEFAPEVAVIMSDVMTNLRGMTDPDLLELVRARVAQLLRNDVEQAGERIPPDKIASVAQWPTSQLFSERERAVLCFTEQFVMDVAGVSKEQRASLGAHMKPAELGGFVMALYLLDYGLRTQMALDRLFPDTSTGTPSATRPATAQSRLAGRPAPGVESKGGVDLNALLMAIARLDSLDMVTAEVVRLRGARRHNCRICQSTRSVKALDEGADEAMFDKIDNYERSDLTVSHKVALRLADAIITQPGEIDPSLVADVHRQFTPAQIVELVLDVMRNSAQKVAVALAVDDPHVTTGVELYALTEDGDVEFLGAPAA